MVDRMAITQGQNGTVLRITKPGVSATVDKNPFILSSDYDYLKRHSSGNLWLDKVKNGGSTDYFGVVSFPELDFIPLVFYNYQIHHSQSRRRIVYPADREGTGIEGTWITPSNTYCLITRSELWFRASGVNVSFDLEMRYIVFANRMTG